MIRSICFAFVLGTLCASTLAAPVPPPGYSTDTGAGVFLPTANVITIETFDLGSVSSGTGFSFGFAYANDPATMTTVFDTGDDFATNTAQASIDFVNGLVFDVDQNAVQSNFAVAAGPITFWLSNGTQTVYTLAALNGGLDMAFHFQHMTLPANSLLAFERPDGQLLGAHFFSGITAIVPIPATLPLLAGAFGLLGLYSRRRPSTQS